MEKKIEILNRRIKRERERKSLIFALIQLTFLSLSLYFSMMIYNDVWLMKIKKVNLIEGRQKKIIIILMIHIKY